MGIVLTKSIRVFTHNAANEDTKDMRDAKRKLRPIESRPSLWLPQLALQYGIVGLLRYLYLCSSQRALGSLDISPFRSRANTTPASRLQHQPKNRVISERGPGTGQNNGKTLRA